MPKFVIVKHISKGNTVESLSNTLAINEVVVVYEFIENKFSQTIDPMIFYI